MLRNTEGPTAADGYGRHDSLSDEIMDEDCSTHESTNNSPESSDLEYINYDNGFEEEILQIREWAIECKICQTYLDKLLAILRARLLPTLPKSSKTFLGTSNVSYHLEDMEDSEGGVGQFVYFGIENALRECINKKLHENKIIELQIHVDGMPLTKSGFQQFWPTLGKVHLDSDLYKPFEIAIFQGKSKPKSSEIYLDKLVKELNELQRDGIEISNTHFNIRLKCVIADTPARAFLKNTLGHGGLYACERCTVTGVKKEHTTVYSSTNAEERTDISFRNYQQPEHHHGPSPFVKVMPLINMVTFFVLDFMHLCCQGIMKKLIEYWVSGDLNFKLSTRNKAEVTRRLLHIKPQIPCEFQRKTCLLKYILKWKATQLRFFLLYCGPVVLKAILREELYNHFLLLHAACRILCSKVICLKYLKQGKEYLTSFFIAMKDYYGDKSQILNAHHLIHLADDVKFMRCNLSIITAFPFESLLGKIRNHLRTPHRALAQLCRRLSEERLLRNRKPNIPPLVEIIKYSRRGNVKQIKYNGFLITTASPDNMIILNDDKIIKVKKIIGNSASPELLQVKGVVWAKKKTYI